MLIEGGGGGGVRVIQLDCCKVNRELIIVEIIHNFVYYDRKKKI